MKYIRKTSLLIAVIILVSLAMLPAQAGGDYGEIVSEFWDGVLKFGEAEEWTGTHYMVLLDCNENAEGAIEIPSEINGLKVEYVDSEAFSGCTKITSVTIPDVTYLM